ncbi:MAG: hypothetical protein QOI27_2608 [Gaiellaceae bacterium]|nr:hypothetical protein [Gaiellaceae bacterium]
MAEWLDTQLGKTREVAAGIPSPEHECDPLGQQPAGYERERLGGCTVEPLRVVDHAEERLSLGGFGQQAENRQPDKKRAGRRAAAQAEGHAERLALQSREMGDEVEDRRAQLLQRRVIKLHLPLDTRGSNDAEVVADLDGTVEQRGLADTGVSVNDED